MTSSNGVNADFPFCLPTTASSQPGSASVYNHCSFYAPPPPPADGISPSTPATAVFVCDLSSDLEVHDELGRTASPAVVGVRRNRVAFDPNVFSMEASRRGAERGDVNLAHEPGLEELGPDDMPLSSLTNSLRYQMPRLSLLGKPLQVRGGLLRGNQDAKYRRLQARIYNFLERPKSWQAITYHVFV